MVRRIAITGGIASGKSTVGHLLSDAGIPVLDTDHVVHQLLKGDEAAKKAIFDAFGDQVFDVSGGDSPWQSPVNRKALGTIVFSNDESRHTLEGILHPRVRQAVETFFATHHNSPLAAVLIPLVFETGQTQYYDEIWLVLADEEQQIQRLQHSRHLTREQALDRIRSQMPQHEKMKRTPYHINNTGSLDSTRDQVGQYLAPYGLTLCKLS